MQQAQTAGVAGLAFRVVLRAQARQNGPAVERQHLIGHEVGEFGIVVVERLQRRLNEVDVVKRPLFKGVADQLQPAGAGRRQRVHQRLEDPGARLPRRQRQLHGVNRFQRSRRPGFALRVEDGADEGGQFEKRVGRVLFPGTDQRLHGLSDASEHGRLGAGLFQRRDELFEAEIARRRDAAGDGQPPRFVIHLR